MPMADYIALSTLDDLVNLSNAIMPRLHDSLNLDKFLLPTQSLLQLSMEAKVETQSLSRLAVTDPVCL